MRERANLLLRKGLEDELPHFRIDLARLEDAADLTLEVTRAAYPDLDIPFHSRWRHFVLDGQDRWASLAGAAGWRDRAARARAEFDLAIVSVLLDAGAGPDWRFRDAAAGREIGRSEGLALASLAMFAGGAFSAHPGDPLRADARALERLADETLRAGFQAGDANPLLGLAGRADLLRRLGRTVAAAPAIFGDMDGRGPAACSIISPASPPAAASKPPPSCASCSSISGRSGRRGSRWAAFPWAIAGGILRCARTTPPTGWCRSTSCRNGSPIP